jgi:hypothetical protein
MSANFTNPNRSGRSHVGTGPRHTARSSNPLVNYEMSGTVRWLDVDLERMVLGVEGTDGHAGAFLGRDVTVDLEMARVHGASLDGLLPGTRVRVKLRLPRDLGAELPDLVAAYSVQLAEAAA